VRLKMTAADGKERLTDAADIETILRIIQSIPSPNAEPFKQWLARLGDKAIKEEHARRDAIAKDAEWLQERDKLVLSE